MLTLPGPASADANSCSRRLNDGANAAALATPITLTAAANSAQRNINFGTSRATKVIKRLTFTTDKALPMSVTPAQLNVDALISRAGDNLESSDFPDPTFSEPRISPDRQTVEFDVCLSPGAIPPGKYVGALTVSGPPGLSAASVALTINAKVDTLFYLGAGLSLLAAFLLLVVKDAAAFRSAEHAKTPSVERRWGDSFAHPLLDPIWWVTTVVALAAAFGTLFAAYASNPAWGSGGLTDIAALIGAAFAAVGGQTIISTLTPSST